MVSSGVGRVLGVRSRGEKADSTLSSGRQRNIQMLCKIVLLMRFVALNQRAWNGCRIIPSSFQTTDKPMSFFADMTEGPHHRANQFDQIWLAAFSSL